MAITAVLVKELRERTGAGMMECKKALTETNGDMEAAIELMRKAGQAKAAKKAGRIAAEGIIVIKVAADEKSAAMVEINSETDFAAKDANFVEFANKVAAAALKNKSGILNELMSLSIEENSPHTVLVANQNLVAKIGENIQVRRVIYMQGSGIIGSYCHGGKIGVLVDLAKANAVLAKDIAMHIAASKPEVINPENLGADIIAKEKEIFIAQAEASGKPKEIIEKMIIGRIKKFQSEVSLVGQPFVKDPGITVGELLQKDQNKVLAFTRFEVGEGIEKIESDFAKEVEAQIKGS